jgi:hypothetical protein
MLPGKQRPGGRPIGALVVADLAAPDRAAQSALLTPGRIIFDPVGWIGDHQLRMSAVQHRIHDLRVGAVSAYKPVFPDAPDVPGDAHRPLVDLRHLVLVGEPAGPARRQCGGELLFGEAEHRQVRAERGEVGEFELEHLHVPTSVECDPIIGEDQLTPLDLREAAQGDHRDLGEPELPGGGEPAVPGDHITAPDGKKCLQKQTGAEFACDTARLQALDEAKRLLVSWGNRGSHSLDVVRAEAAKLIEACEKGLDAFQCGGCKQPLWMADAGNKEWVQCQCGHLRWRYGKG